MNIKQVIFALIALSFIATLFAEPQKAPSGGQYGQVEISSLEGNGQIKLNGTTVTNLLKLNGSLLAQNSDIGSLDVMGEVNLTETTIQHGGFIMGAVQTVRSKIKEPITILSQKAIFTASELGGITIKQDSAFKGKQTIELRQGTIVDGPIHFESGKGEVLLYNGSQVLGPITGAAKKHR